MPFLVFKTVRSFNHELAVVFAALLSEGRLTESCHIEWNDTTVITVIKSRVTECNLKMNWEKQSKL